MQRPKRAGRTACGRRNCGGLACSAADICLSSNKLSFIPASVHALVSSNAACHNEPARFGIGADPSIDALSYLLGEPGLCLKVRDWQLLALHNGLLPTQVLAKPDDKFLYLTPEAAVGTNTTRQDAAGAEIEFD